MIPKYAACSMHQGGTEKMDETCTSGHFTLEVTCMFNTDYSTYRGSVKLMVNLIKVKKENRIYFATPVSIFLNG
jgi:hypothetical protein